MGPNQLEANFVLKMEAPLKAYSDFPINTSHSGIRFPVMIVLFSRRNFFREYSTLMLLLQPFEFPSYLFY